MNYSKRVQIKKPIVSISMNSLMIITLSQTIICHSYLNQSVLLTILRLTFNQAHYNILPIIHCTY